MKSNILLIFFLAAYINVTSNNTNEKQINSKITHVTVFLQGAEIEHSASYTLQAGETVLKLSDLTSDIDKNSIQVKADGKCTILSVNHKVNFLKNQETNAKIEKLQQDISKIEFLIKTQKSEIQVVESQKDLLQKNKLLGGSDKSVTAVELKSASDFYRNKYTELAFKNLRLEQSIDSLQKQKDVLKKQISELGGNQEKTVSEIYIKVKSETTATTKFQISYYTFNASWTPKYDIRVKDISNPIELITKADIYQNTGINWDNVKLTLSTAQPQQGNIIPEIYPWIINFQPEYNIPQKPVMLKREISEESAEIMYDMEMSSAPIENNSIKNHVVQSEKITNYEYKISIPYTIPTDGKAYTVAVNDMKIQATYKYSAVPKYNTDAFLMAQITDWEQYNLLSGEANLYFEGTYIGQTYIDFKPTTDTLLLSLGRDKSIIVKREKLKDYSSKKLIGFNKKEAVSWEFTVRNTKKDSVTIDIEDHIPVSMNSEIVIETDIPKDFTQNSNGLLILNLNLAPSESRKITYSYSVKYPKDKKIDLE